MKVFNQSRAELLEEALFTGMLTLISTGQRVKIASKEPKSGARKAAAMIALTEAHVANREGLMVPIEREGAIQNRVAGNSLTVRLPPMSANPHGRVVCQRSSKGYRQSEPTIYRMSVRTTVISIGVIDAKLFTRECITRSLQTLDDRLDIVSFATCEDYLRIMGSHDLILYHAHEPVANWDVNSQQLVSFKKLLQIVPVIILSDVDCSDSIIEMFESGARGFISTDNTTLEQIIEIIGFVKVGGTFVPPSSLFLRRMKGQAVTAGAIMSDRFTSSEMAVLDRLKLGKPNKIIAHELGVSESTVKVHVGRIMKKLKATNRTQVVCLAYALAATGVRGSRGEA
jgi:DNA-binding NarL/FixJ family response regulator